MATDKVYPDLVSEVGNVGRDPEYKEWRDGTYCNFSLAVTRQYGQGEDGKTEWVRVTVWKEELHPWLKANVQKGSRVVVEGNRKVTEYNGAEQVEISAVRVGLVEWGVRSKAVQRDDDDAF